MPDRVLGAWMGVGAAATAAFAAATLAAGGLEAPRATRMAPRFDCACPDPSARADAPSTDPERNPTWNSSSPPL